MTDQIDHGRRPWTAIPRDILRDDRLSAAAKGALCLLLSHDAEFVRSVIGILRRYNDRCGKTQAQSIMAELVRVGYAELVRTRRPNGTFQTCYVIRPEASSDAGTDVSPRPVYPAPVQPAPVNLAAVVEPLEVDPLEERHQRGLATASPSRPRDEIFEALYGIWLGKAYSIAGGSSASLTTAARGKLNTAARELRGAGATVEQLQGVPAAWVILFAGPNPPTLTPNAIVAHWPALLAIEETGYVARGSGTAGEALGASLDRREAAAMEIQREAYR